MGKLEEEGIQCEEEVINEDQPNLGLGLKPQKRSTRSNNNEATKQKSFTPSPPSRSPRIISQKDLNAFAYEAMSNLPKYSTARAGIPSQMCDTID